MVSVGRACHQLRAGGGVNSRRGRHDRRGPCVEVASVGVEARVGVLSQSKAVCKRAARLTLYILIKLRLLAAVLRGWGEAKQAARNRQAVGQRRRGFWSRLLDSSAGGATGTLSSGSDRGWGGSSVPRFLSGFSVVFEFASECGVVTRLECVPQRHQVRMWGSRRGSGFCGDEIQKCLVVVVQLETQWTSRGGVIVVE